MATVKEKEYHNFTVLKWLRLCCCHLPPLSSSCCEGAQLKTKSSQIAHKWTKVVRYVAVGDLVYLAESEIDDQNYRMGVVEEGQPGEDGRL